MGLFDLFGKDPKIQKEKTEPRFDFRAREKKEDNKGPVSIFSPTSYEEVGKIIDALKSNKTAIVHLTELKAETAIRVIDMLSGAIYALGGGVYEMEKNIFMFSPVGVEIN